MKVIPFGSWLPDLPDYANPGATVAKNVIPASDSYMPFKDMAVQSDAFGARVRGALAARDADGSTYFYAGEETKIQEVRNQSVTDKTHITISGSSTASGSSTTQPYTTASLESWEFTIFENRMVAANFTDAVQGITIGSSGLFADLFTSTNKPKARHIATVRDFLVLGNTTDTTDGNQPWRVWWSGIGDALDMDPDSTTQSDFEDLKEGGAVQKVVGGIEYGLIFQQRQINRMVYRGSPLVFGFTAIDRQRGTPVPNSVIAHGRNVFFWSEEGIFVNDGTQSISLGHNRWDRWLWDQFDVANAHRVSASIDPINKIVVWAFPGENSSAGMPNHLLLYNWKDDKAAEVEIDTDMVVLAETQAFTLEQLDNISTDIDAGVLSSFDSPDYQGGQLRFSAFDADHKLAYFTGANLAATLETGEFQYTPGQRSLLRKHRPLIDGGTITVALAGRNRLIDAVSFGTSVSMNGVGDVWLRHMARYHRERHSIAAGGTWTHAQGVEIHGTGMGDR